MFLPSGEGGVPYKELTSITGQPISEPESELLYDWHFMANQFVLVTSSLRLSI
jgi:hypothetical protein